MLKLLNSGTLIQTGNVHILAICHSGKIHFEEILFGENTFEHVRGIFVQGKRILQYIFG